jgi:hypothetical protein
VSTLAPAKPADKQDKRVTPPDEQFWVRYSPHYEMPLSWVGSGAVHLLILGLLVLMGIALPFLLKDNSSVPIDVVAMSAPGGSGGNPNGVGGNPGAGASGENNGVLPIDENDRFGEKVAADLPNPTGPRPFLETLQNGFAQRVIDQNNIAVKNILNLHKTTAHGIHEGLGARDGKGGEKGNDEGPGKEDGKGTLSVREQRMLRWTMSFDIRNGEDYAKQLCDLGVFIAIEIPDEPDTVRVYKDLGPDAKGKATKLKDISRMPWIDGRKESVSALCTYMGIKSEPSRIIAYMTEEMEKNLLKMELKAAGGVEEDKIKETVFKIVKRGDKYEPVVASQRK